MTAPHESEEMLRERALRAEKAYLQRETDGDEPDARTTGAKKKKSKPAPAPSKEREGAFVNDVEPWLEAVDGAALLHELSASFLKYVVMGKHAADACALWTVHTHGVDAADITPRLCAASPVKRCGKSTLLDVAKALVRRPLSTSNITPAAVFRVLDEQTVTLIVDEADTFLGQQDDLRGILNAGHRRSSAVVIRCEGKTFKPRTFACWGAVCIALIGELPGTLHDRSIVIQLARKHPDEQITRWALRDRDVLERLQRQAARWVADHAEALKSSPYLELGNDRASDNWGPLLAIADTAGWGSRARAAAKALTKNQDAESEAVVVLLADIQKLFNEKQTKALSAQTVLTYLLDLDERPWRTINKGQPIDAHTLGRLLKPFKIKTGTVRVKEKSAPVRGYHRDWFADAWSRYVTGNVTP